MRVLAISLISAVFFATVGLGWLFDQAYRVYFQQDEQQSQTNAVAAVEAFGKDLRTLILNRDFDQKSLAAFVDSWPLNGDYQLALIPSQNFPLPTELKQDLLAGEPLILASEDDLSIYYYLPKQQQLLIVSSATLQELPADEFDQYLFTGLFYLCLLLFMLLWLYPLVNRLLALRGAAKNFGQGQLEQRVEVGSVSYIRDLELEFNHMAQRISDLVGDVKLLSSAVSHDLRTPLATIRFGIDTLQEEDDPELRKKFEQRISDNVDEMIELVEILLNYARLDQALVALEKEPLVLTDMIEQLAANLESTYSLSSRTQRLDIELDLPDSQQPAAKVLADRKYLSMLFKNLLQNARQHCRNRIKLSVKYLPQAVSITIGDDGDGIAPEQRQQIIKPFVRGKAEHKGYGVGLAIVQRILHWHDGDLVIGQCPTLGGAEFKVQLPLDSK